jgi:hypothetical protein
MGTHLYVCENDGPLVVATEGAPPRWVTCPTGNGVECNRCEGAQLQGAAKDFGEGEGFVYRCKSGHARTLRLPAGVGRPESAHCPDCDGLMLPTS